MAHNLAIRLATVTGTMDDDTAEAVIDYEFPVELFPSGQEAARHGLKQVAEPGERAEKTIEKLLRRRALREQ